MDEQKKFLETAETEYAWYYPMLKVMLLTGMRISEVGRLWWSDIDYNNDVIHIRRALFSQYEYGKKKYITLQRFFLITFWIIGKNVMIK